MTLGYVGSCLREAVEDWQPDLIAIGVPTSYHATISEELTDYSSVVLMEKPVGTNLDECRRVSSALRRAKTFVNFQLRGLTPVRRIRDAIRRGALGELLLVRIDERSSAFLKSPEGWHFRPGQGGGQRLSMLSHLIDLANFLLQQAPLPGATPRVHLLPDPQRDPEHSVACGFQVGSAVVELTSSASAVAVRSVAIEVVGSAGRAQLEFVNGHGDGVLLDGSTRQGLWRHVGTETSLFRLAFPHYLDGILDHMSSDEKPSCTSKGTGVAFLANLDDAMLVHRILSP